MNLNCLGCGLAGEGFKVCGQCRKVRYCSVECQKASWPQHKRECVEAAKAQEVSNKEDPARTQQFSEEYWVTATFYEALEKRRQIQCSFLRRNLQYMRFPSTKPKLHLSCDDVLEVCHNKLNQKSCQKTLQKTLVLLLDRILLSSPLLPAMIGSNALTIRASLSGVSASSPPLRLKAKAHTHVLETKGCTEMFFSTTVRPHPFEFPHNLSPSLSSAAATTTATTTTSTSFAATTTSSSLSLFPPFASSCSLSLSSPSSPSSSSVKRKREETSSSSSFSFSSLPSSCSSSKKNKSDDKNQVQEAKIETTSAARDATELVQLSFDSNFLEHKPASQKIVFEFSPVSGKKMSDESLKWEVSLVQNRQFLASGIHAVHSPAGTLFLRVGWRYSAKRERSAVNYYDAGRPTKSQQPRVTYKYFTTTDKPALVETREGFGCPYCKKDFYLYPALVCHLETSHDRFSFRCVSNGTREIHVTLKPPDTTPLSRTWGFVGGQGLRKSITCKFMRLCDPPENGKDKEIIEDDEEEGEEEDVTVPEAMRRKAAKKMTANKPVKTPTQALSNRLFFHTNTFFPVRPCELAWNSDEEVDEEWKIKMQERDLDEYDDLSWSEKTFMKLWNRFAHDKDILPNRSFSDRCLDFATFYATKLLTQNLRSAFLFHLLTMWEFGKIQSTCILECLVELDSHNSPSKKPEKAEVRTVQHLAQQGEQRWLSSRLRALDANVKTV